MATLVVDIDVLQTTINTYNTELVNLYAAERAITRSLTSLKASGWDSGAGRKWFSLLDDEWRSSIQKQFRYFAFLRDCILDAKDEYSKVYEEQQQLSNYL